MRWLDNVGSKYRFHNLLHLRSVLCLHPMYWLWFGMLFNPNTFGAGVSEISIGANSPLWWPHIEGFCGCRLNALQHVLNKAAVIAQLSGGIHITILALR